MMLPDTGSANWNSEEHNVQVELYGSGLGSGALAGILDPFVWDGQVETMRAYLERMSMRKVRIRSTSTSASGRRLIEIEAL
jgi:hypothetical protein